MSCAWVFAPVLVLTVTVAGFSIAQDAKEKAEDAVDLNNLSLEVNALQTLHSLKLTDTQLQKLRALAKESAAKPGKRTAAVVSKDYREKLLALHKALLEQADERIDELNDELDELRDAENPTIDDNVELTPAARKRAPEAVKLMRVQQVKDYLDVLGDDLGDPVAELVEAFETLRGLKGKDWKERRDEVVDKVVRLAAGVDADKADKLSDKLTALLITAHTLLDAEFKDQRPKLEESARQTLGDPGPFQVMRNAVEYSLAELLSNPRLVAAIDARLNPGK